MVQQAQMTSPFAQPAWSVLLVDHHQDTRTMYGEYLNREGCVVEEAADGREALAKAIARRYDVIVAATRLPGIDGYQLCELLRRDLSTMSTRVIMMSGDGVLDGAERALAVGADATVTKPCLPEELFAKMRTLLEEQPASASGASMASEAVAMRAGQTVLPASTKRPILSRVHHRGPTTTPPLAPPNLRCPGCDKPLVYHHSNIGGVSARHSEQWDYFECASECGTFEYRHRTRRIRRVPQN